MLLFADEFWKLPSVYDVVGVIAFFASMWFAVRDIRARIREARHELLVQVARVARSQQLADLRHCLELMREAARARSWKRAGVHVDMAVSYLARLPVCELSPFDQSRLSQAADDIRYLAGECSERRENAERLSRASVERLQCVIRVIGELERGARLGASEEV